MFKVQGWDCGDRYCEEALVPGVHHAHDLRHGPRAHGARLRGGGGGGPHRRLEADLLVPAIIRGIFLANGNRE